VSGVTNLVRFAIRDRHAHGNLAALVKRLAILLVFFAATTASAQSDLFPRFSVSGGRYLSRFDTDVRVDPDQTGGGFGTTINLERDLSLERSPSTNHFALEWRPFDRHELAGTYLSVPRSGFRAIEEQIVFRDVTYPVRAQVTTQVNFRYWDATYTYWARKTPTDGLGITLGVAGLSLDAMLEAVAENQQFLAQERASTDVPVALAGAKWRFAIARPLLAEVKATALPRIHIQDYSGRALNASASLEFRIAHTVGIGAAYNYFTFDANVERTTLHGHIRMHHDGPEAYVKLAF
jgi:hypothetical protein